MKLDLALDMSGEHEWEVIVDGVSLKAPCMDAQQVFYKLVDTQNSLATATDKIRQATTQLSNLMCLLDYL